MDEAASDAAPRPLPVHDYISESFVDAVTNTESVRTPFQKRCLFTENDDSAHRHPFGINNGEVGEGGNSEITERGGGEDDVQML